jgi:hypothetical protein
VGRHGGGDGGVDVAPEAGAMGFPRFPILYYCCAAGLSTLISSNKKAAIVSRTAWAGPLTATQKKSFRRLVACFAVHGREGREGSSLSTNCIPKKSILTDGFPPLYVSKVSALSFFLLQSPWIHEFYNMRDSITCSS